MFLYYNKNYRDIGLFEDLDDLINDIEALPIETKIKIGLETKNKYLSNEEAIYKIDMNVEPFGNEIVAYQIIIIEKGVICDYIKDKFQVYL